MGRKKQEIGNLFAYGTLMLEKTFLAITKQKFKSKPAYLNNHQIYQVKNQNYPGIIPDKGTVKGLIYFDIPSDIFKKLDEYEGNEYTRENLSINLNATNQIKAWCYLYKDNLKTNLLKDHWSLEWYQQNKN